MASLFIINSLQFNCQGETTYHSHRFFKFLWYGECGQVALSYRPRTSLYGRNVCINNFVHRMLTIFNTNFVLNV